MKKKIITTGDGSKTIQIIDWNEQYHSTHGAIAEAKHVYISQGLQHYIGLDIFKSQSLKTISILEIGFGTGLNTILTLINAKKDNLNINYTGVEAYPVTHKELKHLNYTELLNPGSEEYFYKLHKLSWNKKHKINKNFTFTKQLCHFEKINTKNSYNVVYFDAFGPRVQPNLWSIEIFIIMYNAMKQNGILVTYSAKGSVRRAMQTTGFKVERLPGPPGKREMLRATKL